MPILPWGAKPGTSGGGSSPLTTKGDVYTYSTVDARLGVGTNGQVLTADSAQTTGLKWAAVGGTGTVTSVDVSGGTTGLTTSGGPVTTSGTITLAGTVVVANGGTGATTLTGIIKGTGTTAMVAATAGTDYSSGTSALTTGILKSTTTTGALTIAIAADFPTLNQNTTGSSASFTGSLVGDVTGTQGATTVGKINGTSLAGLATGILKNTTTTGVPSIAIAGDFPTLNQSTTGSAATLTTPRTFQTNLAITTAVSFDGSANNVHGVTGTLPVANGGTAKTSVTIAPTASSWAGWDANKNLSANNVGDGFTTTATAAGTTTLTIASTGIQVFTGSTTQTVKLPTTSVAVGGDYIIINNSTGLVTVQSSGANTITILDAGTSAIFTAVVATPTTAANWNSQYLGIKVASGKSLSASNTLTLAGTDGTTMTFPGSSNTVMGLAATQTNTAAKTFNKGTLLDKGEIVYDVKAYGAVGNGSTDDTTAIQATITAAQASGGSVYLPSGTYKITAALTVTSAIRIFGDSTPTSIIAYYGNINGIYVTGGGTVVEHLSIKHQSTAAASGAALYFNGAANSFAQDVFIQDCYDGLQVSNSQAFKAEGVDIWYFTNTGYRLDGDANNDYYISKAFLNGAVTGTGTAGTGKGIYLADKNEAIILDTIEVILCTFPFYSTSTLGTYGHRFAYSRVINCYFDSSANEAHIDYSYENTFIGCWFSNRPNSGMVLTNSDSTEFLGCAFANCGQHGAVVQSTAVRTIFNGCKFIANSTATANTYDGLIIAAGTTDFVVTNCTATNGLGFTGTQNYGILISSGASDRYMITNNLLTGNTAGGLSDSGSGVAKEVQYTDNVHTFFSQFIPITGSAGSPTTPASGTGLIAMAGTGAVSPKFYNSSGGVGLHYGDHAADANGWTVYNYGGWNVYKKRVTFSLVVGGTATGITLSSTNLPAGLSNIGSYFLKYSYTATSFAGELLIVFEGSSAATALNFTGSSTNGTSRTYTGFIDVELTYP